MGLFKKKSPTEQIYQPSVIKLLSYRVRALQGQGMRENQEDAFIDINSRDVSLIKQHGLLFAVADGMGGMAGGEVASNTAIETLTKEFYDIDKSTNIGTQLSTIAVKAGKNIFNTLDGKGGSTLVACIIFNEHLYWTSVGDSYIFLKRQGFIYRLNQSQNLRSRLYAEIADSNTLNHIAADENPDGNRLSSFLGMPELALSPEYNRRPLRLLDDDAILVCSDGIAGVLDDNEIAECMNLSSPSEICDLLDIKVKEKQRQHQDNYTAVVVKCNY